MDRGYKKPELEPDLRLRISVSFNRNRNFKEAIRFWLEPEMDFQNMIWNQEIKQIIR